MEAGAGPHREPEKNHDDAAVTALFDVLMAALALNGDACLILDPQGAILRMNPAAEALFRAPADAIIGQNVVELAYPHERALVQEALRAAAAGHWQGDLPIYQADGGRRICEAQSMHLFTSDGGTAGMLVTLHDITDTRHYERHLHTLNRVLRVLSNVNQAIIHSTNELSLVQHACRLLVEDGAYRYVGIALVAPDTRWEFATIVDAGEQPGVLAAQIQMAPVRPEDDRPLVQVLQDRHDVYVADLRSDPRHIPFRDAILAQGFLSLLYLPLVHEKTTLGIIAFYAEQGFDSAEIGLLHELAIDIGFGVGAARNQQARRSAEAQLRASETKFRSLAEFAHVAIAVIQGERLIYANPFLVQLSGYTQDELQNFLVEQLIHPDYRADVGEKISALLHGEKTTDRLLYRMMKKGGEPRWIDLSVAVIPQRDEPTLIGIGIDVTDRVHAEAQLREERAFLDAAVEILPFPLLFFSAQGELMRQNRANQAFWPGSLPTDWWEIKLLEPDTRAVIPLEQWPAMRALHGEMVMNLEAISVLPDGREIPVLIQAAPIFLDGRQVAVIVAFQDITPLKEADRAKTRFLDILSHELKTPLTTIIGWTQAARDDIVLAPQALEVIERNAQRQRAMLNDLIDVSRLLHGKLFLSPVVADLWPLAVAAIDAQRLTIEVQQLQLSVEAPAEPLVCRLDRERIRKVLEVLLGNAIRFNHPQGKIIVRAWRQATQAVVTVQDTGRGIAPEQLPLLFQPFRQIERLEQTGGLGMGLLLARGIVEGHGGTLTVDSPGLGGGATFTMTLPLAGSSPLPPASFPASLA